jgi:hypothetical protein
MGAILNKKKQKEKIRSAGARFPFKGYPLNLAQIGHLRVLRVRVPKLRGGPIEINSLSSGYEYFSCKRHTFSNYTPAVPAFILSFSFFFYFFIVLATFSPKMLAGVYAGTPF